MIQNMVLGGSGGDGGNAEIKTSTATVATNSNDISFSVDGIPTWFLLYAESATRPTESSRRHLVMAYGEVDLSDSGEGYSYGQSTNCYYISYYGAVSLVEDKFTEYWYEDGMFGLMGYGSYYKMPANAVYNLCYTT